MKCVQSFRVLGRFWSSSETAVYVGGVSHAWAIAQGTRSKLLGLRGRVGRKCLGRSEHTFERLFHCCLVERERRRFLQESLATLSGVASLRGLVSAC